MWKPKFFVLNKMLVTLISVYFSANLQISLFDDAVKFDIVKQKVYLNF